LPNLIFTSTGDSFMHQRTTLKLLAASALLAFAGTALAQNTIKIANIVELSGGGATAGTNFKNGVELAVKEINASGSVMVSMAESRKADGDLGASAAK
jgi:branched-chain amino acid transport system substrate-binding protein